jgi:1-acyl-sn-glycerol-3-phosphate acyltransferase
MEKTPGTTNSTETREDGLRKALRWIYLPWSWLVFLPYAMVSTLIWGIIAAGICVFSPRLAFHCGTIWAWCLCRVNFTPVKVEGREHAKRGQSYIIMSNHQSQFDILAFYSTWRRQFRWVLKEELRKIPGLGWYCSAGGHIFIDRRNREKAIASLRSARPLLEGGISVIIFPEGSRSHDGRMGDFKKGGFMMALELGLPILPVSISGSQLVLPYKSLRSLPGKIRIQIHKPMDALAYGPDRRHQLMADVRTAIASGLTPWEGGDQTGIGAMTWEETNIHVTSAALTSAPR